MRRCLCTARTLTTAFVWRRPACRCGFARCCHPPQGGRQRGRDAVGLLHHPQHAVPDLQGQKRGLCEAENDSPPPHRRGTLRPLTKLLGRKKAAATARSEVPWISGRGKGGWRGNDRGLAASPRRVRSPAPTSTRRAAYAPWPLRGDSPRCGEMSRSDRGPGPKGSARRRWGERTLR